MKAIVLAGFATIISTTCFAQTPGEFLGQDYRDRGAAYIATDRAREDFAISRERAENGNFYGAEIARERGDVERNRADNDVYAADRNRDFYRMTR